MVNSEFFTNMRHMILLVCHRSNKINDILTNCALIDVSGSGRQVEM
jgi:hypothetical protein